MNEINYQNKVALNENPEIADINKVTDDDMNEIKSVVNGNSRTSSNNFGLGTNTWTSSATYSIGDIVVYNDNTYKNLTGTNTTTTPDQDNTNWETVPLIVNEKSDSTKNAYSCDYVNNALIDTYSTDEVKTNEVWIDGKPIYRKVYNYTNLPAGTVISESYNSGLTNVKITKFDTYILRQGTDDFESEYFYNSTDYIRAFYRTSSNTIELRAYIGSIFDVFITLEYTKTTD